MGSRAFLQKDTGSIYAEKRLVRMGQTTSENESSDFSLDRIFSS